LKVLRINAKDTHHIRKQVLREGYPVDTCKFDGDEDDQTFHLGAFSDGKLVSIASFYFEKHMGMSPTNIDSGEWPHWNNLGTKVLALLF